MIQKPIYENDNPEKLKPKDMPNIGQSAGFNHSKEGKYGISIHKTASRAMAAAVIRNKDLSSVCNLLKNLRI